MPDQRLRRKLTKRRLANIGRHYLDRHASSVARFRLFLLRRARRELDPGEPLDQVRAWIDDIAEELCRLGLLDDTRYARREAVRGVSLGRTPRRIRVGLRAKGVAQSIATAVAPNDSDAEWTAAVAIARRRRIGPYRETTRDRGTDTRDLGVLARAGIPFGIAQRLIKLQAPP